MNAHLEIRIAKTDITRVLASLELMPGLDADEQLRADMIEGETSLHELVSKLLTENEDDEGQIMALEEQIGARSVRKERAKARIEARKNAIASLMDCAQQSSLKLPEATVSLRMLAPRPKVTDADQLPDAFVDVVEVRKPNLDAIKEVIERGQSIPGVTMTNGASSLSVRRK
jgi:hypothetical protein